MNRDIYIYIPNINTAIDFHSAVATSVIALNNLLVKQEDPEQAMRHLSRTFHLVNQRLSSPDPVSDSTIAVVVSLTHYDRLRGQYRQGLVHLEGLRQIVELRGGVSEFTKSHRSLALKIFR
jgi:hypothetical protein